MRAIRGIAAQGVIVVASGTSRRAADELLLEG
jgi:hypothetical protein